MIELLSCGDRHGPVPLGDLGINATLLPMPSRIARAGTGFDPLVREQVLFGNPLVIPLLEMTAAAAHAIHELTASVLVVVACSDGRHRSVAAVEWLAWHLREQYGVEPKAVRVVHRDLDGGELT